MKVTDDNPNKTAGFTIVELLTVMSIIILLISLLVPALNRVRRYAMGVKQKAQFHSIAVALDLFSAEFDDYPDSNRGDDLGWPYCGAMKLAEAMVGQDLKGFNPKSRFRRSEIPRYYPRPAPAYSDPPTQEYLDYNIKGRKMYLQLENANVYELGDIYDPAILGSSSPDYGGVAYDPNIFVLCDVYNRVTNRTTGKRIGMPILYYRADTTKVDFPLPGEAVAGDSGNYIYDIRDNQGLVEKGMPFDSSRPHSLSRNMGGDPDYPNRFYDLIRDPMVPTLDRPYRADSYILFSAGFDGEYGTTDDVFNFGE